MYNSIKDAVSIAIDTARNTTGVKMVHEFDANKPYKVLVPIDDIMYRNLEILQPRGKNLGAKIKEASQHIIDSIKDAKLLWAAANEFLSDTAHAEYEIDYNYGGNGKLLTISLYKEAHARIPA